MKQSIITDDLKHCVFCGSQDVQIHHCMEGTANRRLSDSDGLIVPLSPKYHNDGTRASAGTRCDVHNCSNMGRLMHMVAELAWERDYIALEIANGKDERDAIIQQAKDAWRKRYGKNYL